MNSIYGDNDPNSALAEDLTQGSGQDELDFSYLYLYNQSCNEFLEDDQDDPGVPSHQDALGPEPGAHEDHPPYGEQPLGQSPYRHPAAAEGLSEHPDLRELLGHSSRPGGPPGQSPRIEITYSELHPHGRDHLHTEPLDIGPRPTLAVPGYESAAYREPPCLSPASSNSSASWSSACSPWASPCVSPGAGAGPAGVTPADLCPRLQAIHAAGSPLASPAEESFLGRRSSSPRPGSRSASPQGKRTYDEYRRSRSPSPRRHEPEPAAVPAGLGELVAGLARPVPTKMVRPSPERSAYGDGQSARAMFPPDQEVKREPAMEAFYVIPPVWPNQLAQGVCSAPVSPLPPLEWPLPSSTEQYELHIEVQPRPHHRAHYETEGSRGAVKAHSGGHPVVQLRGYRGTEPLALQVFIGTADERVLKPHAFYQVHRITGKTVTTNSHERGLYGTKILEVPLEPKDSMRAVVDCAGILKLRNADIELRKGETDVGRKNTRVRLVFRVHVPQPGGQWVSLQVASQPIECSQRSAHELPGVERQDMDHCSVLGGLQMILTGQNFTSDSKVLFTEKTHDGLQIWEAEATVDRDKSQASMLFVEVPPYRDQSIYHPTKVNFYVLNGKRKHSQPQHFTYTPLTVPFIKTEPVDDYQFGQLGCAMSQILGVSLQSCRHTPAPSRPVPPDSCAMPGMGMYAPDPVYQLQCPSICNRSPANSLSSSPVLYQSHTEHPALPGHGGSPARVSCMGTQQYLISATHFNPTSYPPRAGALMAEHQRVMVGDSYQAAASRFPIQTVPDVGSAVPQQRAFGQRVVPAQGRSPPCQSRSLQQTCPPPGHQRGSSPGRVTVKQENLDQAYLDDVNEIIRKDLTDHGSDHS